MSTALYYIDGKLVSVTKARAYYVAGVNHAVVMGYVDAVEVELLWKARLGSEFARESIFDYSAIQADGGLEIIIERE
jgi:hypothetical protein